MRSRTAIWFECKVRFEKVQEDGLQKKVTEQYVVDALSFAEAERRITEEMSAYISGEFEVTDVKKAPYKEVFFSDDAESDRFYKAKLDFITLDEKTEREKRSRVTYLVQAANLKSAMKGVDDVMGGTMIDYDAASLAATNIMDVYEYSQKDEVADKVADLMTKMAEDVKDASQDVEAIVDRYITVENPELRKQLVDRLTEIRRDEFGIE